MGSAGWADAPNSEVLLAAENVLDQEPAIFSRILTLSLDSSLPTSSRLTLLGSLITAFQTLEKPSIRKECAPLVSIAIWHNIHSDEARESQLNKSSALRKAWRASQKRYEAAEAQVQAKMRIERAWLYSMIVDFMGRLNEPSPSAPEEITYCERFLEFLIDLSSQLPTRRYTCVLFQDVSLIPVIRHSRMFKDDKNVLLRDLGQLLRHYLTFPVDNEAAISQTPLEKHYETLAELQKVCLKHFPDKLKVLALSNLGLIDQELESHISSLSDVELEQLCDFLQLRYSYPKAAKVATSRELLLEILLSHYERPSQDVISRLPILPTEESLYDPALLRNESYDGSKPLAIPKLNLQYLSLQDFMWRSFVLHRMEAMYEIRKDMESIIKRMRPRIGREPNTTQFDGFSRMAIPIAKPAIIEVGQPKVGSTAPAFVRSEIVLDVDRLDDRTRREWDNLRPGDVVFVLAVKAPKSSSRLLTNGHGSSQTTQDHELAHLRSAEVVQLLDENGRPLRNTQELHSDGSVSRSRKRRLLVNLDAVSYKKDLDRITKGRSDIYSTINVLARRQGRENNFKSVLETMQKLVKSQTELPAWLQDVYLGYGDPEAATHKHLQNRKPSMDFRDTFLDWLHLNESFPGREIALLDGQTSAIPPPYILQPFTEPTGALPTNPKKRRREQIEEHESSPVPVKVSTYNPPNTGPYPSDAPKLNTVRFTPRQVEGIISGTQPGLTLIVGPPGTGKTDVATQIINLLYHNFPTERVLLIAHSNQALNQLFQKIIALDIDGRHLLRLGHGEEDLDTEGSYSKYGRVESFLENRQSYLFEVSRLAASMDAEGAHGNSCETADYFNQVHVRPAWARWWEALRSAESSPAACIAAFPFHKYFANAPIPVLFPEDATVEEISTIASGCEHHISKIFQELESIRPFEILRHGRDQQNHLLVKEARIIAMTSTHAAMRRAEIAELGFHYDTLVMEEAAQITELESFIPCAMQNPDPKTGELPLKRVILLGDHLQNSPIVQNMALRQYANLEQSLFLRLVRVGVPTINLDQQGRCRPSIANLFKWRYSNLGNLPHLMESAEFARANAGFRYEYQFIDVPDYQGQGEREPSPHFIQNVGEAEYAVALYQYMRLLGYPAQSISILATYAGQKALIKDVLDHRCKANKFFGLPRIVTTVDKYQGEQNEYVILSMTRTKHIGYLRDVRRLTVALSRARLGLYVLGRRELFESTTCPEMAPAMELFEKRPEKLLLTMGEMYPTERLIEAGEEAVGTAEMDGVEHLGQYVFEMTQAKIKASGGRIELMEAVDENEGYVGEVEEQRLDEVEEDPLHEL